MKNSNPKFTKCLFCRKANEPLELSHVLNAYVHVDCVETNLAFARLSRGTLNELEKELANEFTFDKVQLFPNPNQSSNG